MGPVTCRSCGRSYDGALFRKGRVVLCECGEWVERARPEDVRRALGDVADLARRADRITSLVLYSDLPEIDIDIEIEKLREFCRERFPDRTALFEMVYVARWRRMREQGWARSRGDERTCGDDAATA